MSSEKRKIAYIDGKPYEIGDHHTSILKFVKGYLGKAPIQDFPPAVNIGGTEPLNFVNAVPEMDPALIPPSPTPTPKKKK